jgi:cold shock protein
MTGTIKRLLTEKRCGFIRGTDGVDYFFHQYALKNCAFSDLVEGREVSFEDTESDKGPRAEDVYA